MFSKCPGAVNLKYPWPETVKCPFCGENVEIWTDETQTHCPHCHKTITRNRNLTCRQWCSYARECMRGRISCQNRT